MNDTMRHTIKLPNDTPSKSQTTLELPPIMALPPAIPALSELPNRPGDPPFSAWDLWGQTSDIGALNWLTQENVLSAVKEVQTGERVGLKYVVQCLRLT